GAVGPEGTIKIRAGDNIDAIEITFTLHGKTYVNHYGGSGGKPYEVLLRRRLLLLLLLLWMTEEINDERIYSDSLKRTT
ncbi:hypothetical protein GW17_00055903, partial [Ensete ventricosum]